MDSYSVKKINAIQTDLDRCSTLASSQKDVCVIVTGSYGRNEASPESDMDWFIVANETLEQSKKDIILNEVTEVVNKHVEKNAGSTGTFENIISINTLKSNYGGDKETNQDFTRRMLYLLESKSLFNTEMYSRLKQEILELYIKSDLQDHTINRFMLNDVIRYYRTMCTDYEYKVSEGGKTWGVRKIKLRFSRKLLYFSGMLTVASTCYLTRQDKIETTLELLNMAPQERISFIVGDNSTIKLLKIYNEFISEISKAEVRSELEKVERDNRQDVDIYRKLKNSSQHFEWEMEKIMTVCFPKSHPIHTALIF